MSSTTELLAQAAANSSQAEQIYQQIFSNDPDNTDAQVLRDKETALVKLGELYRDQKYVSRVTLNNSLMRGM